MNRDLNMTRPPYRRIVVKVGTSVLTAGTQALSAPDMVELARQCAELHHRGCEVVLCTSGAIAAGRQQLDYPDLPATVANKQMLAAVGQSRLMYMWEQFFEIYGVHVGQILLTHGDVERRRRFLNARDTLLTLIEQRIIPVINENDAVATQEIKIGDNDNLSALVSVLVDADLLILLTDQEGLYTADPRSDEHAELITEVSVIDEDIRALAGGTKGSLGTGGMATKIEAATVARRAGTDVVIASGKVPDVISRLAQGEAIGTSFPAQSNLRENRKRWVLAGAVKSGHIVIDRGAAHALRHKGRSLLPAGITGVKGDFDRGDTISINEESVKNGTQTTVARGIARYPSIDLVRIKGLHSDLIAETLGYTYGTVAVHRNDLILLES